MSRLLNKIRCFIFGHNFYVHRKINATNRRVKCNICKSDWAMNDDTKTLLKWDSDFEELYKDQSRKKL